MLQSWTSGIDRVCVATLDRGVRVLAVVAPRGKAGVSSLAAGIAEASQLSGRATLLFELSAGVASVPPSDHAYVIERDDCGFDRARIALDQRSRQLLSSSAYVRSLLKGDLGTYGAIVLDLPPLLDGSGSAINAAAAAAASDGVLLVALTGSSRREDLIAARQLLDQAGARVAGIAMNDLAAPTLGAEIAREMSRIERILPGLARWVARRALASPLLNRV